MEVPDSQELCDASRWDVSTPSVVLDMLRGRQDVPVIPICGPTSTHAYNTSMLCTTLPSLSLWQKRHDHRPHGYWIDHVALD